jgi:hypothetical protein
MSRAIVKQVKVINNTTTQQLVKINEEAIKITFGEGKNLTQELINFRDSRIRAEYLRKLRRANAVPNTLSGLINILRYLNSSDLCNPFTFAANNIDKIFPPEGKVGSQIAKIAQFVKDVRDVQSSIRNATLIGGNIEAKGTSENGQEFVSSGTIFLDIEGLTKPKKGATLYITQTDDPTVNSQMVGTIENIIDDPFEDPELVEIPILDELGQETGEFETVEFYPDSEVRAVEAGGASSFIINISSLTPITPPYKKTPNGNTVVDEQGEPVVAKFNNFKITYEKEVTSDIKELATEVRDITDSLRELGIVEIAQDLRDIRSVPGLGKLADLAEDIVKIVNQPFGPVNPTVIGINQQGTEIAQTTGQVATTLEGGLTAGQVIERAAIYNDFFRKIEPIINFDFTLENVFKKQIEQANTFLRDFIPYEELAWGISKIQILVKVIVGIVSFILVLLKTINAVIKIVTVIVKVIRIVVKAIRLILKLLNFIAGGRLAGLIEKVIIIEDALSLAIEFLEKISTDLEIVINKLSYIKLLLKEISAQCGKLAAKLESCSRLNGTGQADKLREAAKNAITSVISLNGLSDEDNDLYDAYVTREIAELREDVGDQINEINQGNKLVETPNGYLLELRENVFGFDQFGNLVFFGDLISRTTGVNFEDSEAQAFRSGLKYYTFDKFRNNPIVQQLLQEADRNALANAEQARIADPDDIFGNYIEKYLGYTLKIAEEKPIDQDAQTTIRRRGIALDSNERIVASTELTFNNNIATIVNELKFILKRNIEFNIIGINTPDTQPNQISDEDAINMAESIGVNKLAINNLKAEANNRAASNIAGKPITSIEGRPIDPNSPIETRIGNSPFIPVETDNIGAINTSNGETSNKASSAKSVDVETLFSQPFNDFIQTNPSLQKITSTLDLLSRVDSNTLSKILSQPGSDNFNFEEFTANLKQSVLSEIDPNPEKVQEVTNKTQQWYEGLRAKVRTDWEIKYGGSSSYSKPPPPPFEDYYDNQEKQEIPKWIRFLLRSGYTETEVDVGITQDEIRDKYRIKIDGTNVEIKLRPAFKKRDN